MKATSYFLILLLATFSGNKLIGIASVYLWVFILGNIGTPSSLVSTIVAYTFYIISWVFVPFLVFRIYLCIQHKQFLIPVQYTGGLYRAGIIAIMLFCLTFLAAFLIAMGLPGKISGIPMVMLLLTTGLISIVVTLRCEVPSVRSFLHNHPFK
jgi:hypothetical protein